MHIKLQPALIRWYKLLNIVIGGRVTWGLPDTGLQLNCHSPNELRYDVNAFDAFIDSLENYSA